MSLSRISSSRFPRAVLARCRCSSPIDTSAISDQRPLLNHSAPYSSALQRFGFSSSASPEKDNSKPEVHKQTESSSSEDDHESDPVNELTMEDLVKLVVEKEEHIKLQKKEKKRMQYKVFCSYAKMEFVKARTRREAENSKKFAIQSFAKGLLDVADNLERASSVVKERFWKIDTSADTASAVTLLRTLLEGVGMTEKQLAEVFKKHGMEKYVPIGKQFDPNRHHAVSEVPDASKTVGTVAVVLKAGYMLHDRVLRLAEVGVTVEVEDVTPTEAAQSIDYCLWPPQILRPNIGRRYICYFPS